MASGWNLWVWLQCIGVVSWCCWRYIDILTLINNFPYSACISSFFGSSIPTSLLMFKCFFVLYILYIDETDVHTCYDVYMSENRAAAVM